MELSSRNILPSTQSILRSDVTFKGLPEFFTIVRTSFSVAKQAGQHVPFYGCLWQRQQSTASTC